MNRRIVSIGCLLTFLGGLSACAGREAEFVSLQTLVRERTGLEPQWHHLSGLQDARVASMLLQPVGPEEAVRIALLNNRDLQASLEELGIARAHLLEASLPPNIELEGERSRVPGESAEFGFGATTELSDILFLSMRRKAAMAELDAVRFGTAGMVLEFAHSVRAAFYDYQAAEQMLELDRTVLESAAASFDVAERLYEAGNIPALELANERAFYEEARGELALAEALVFGSRERVNVLMGLSGTDTNWQMSGGLGDPDTDLAPLPELEARAVDRSLDLSQLDHRYQAAARRANLARAEGLLPSLRAGVHLGREEGNREFGPVISVDLPIFNQGQGRVALARSEMRQLEQQYRARAVLIRSAVRAAQNDLLIAARRVGHFRDILLPLREQIVEETQLQYNAMEIGVFQLIEARREQVRTAQEYVAALQEYWHARNSLDQILAGRVVSERSGLGGMAAGHESE